jgi:hypothetical protein
VDTQPNNAQNPAAAASGGVAPPDDADTESLRQAWTAIRDGEPQPPCGRDDGRGITDRAGLLAGCLASYAAEADARIDWAQIQITAATEPGKLHAWLTDFATLAVTDLLRILLAAAWDGLHTATAPIDTLREYAIHLRCIADTWDGLDEQRRRQHDAFVRGADALALFEPATQPDNTDRPAV